MAIYLVRMLRKDDLLAISGEFGLRGYSSAGSVVDGMKKTTSERSSTARAI